MVWERSDEERRSEDHRGAQGPQAPPGHWRRVGEAGVLVEEIKGRVRAQALAALGMNGGSWGFQPGEVRALETGQTPESTRLLLGVSAYLAQPCSPYPPDRRAVPGTMSDGPRRRGGGKIVRGLGRVPRRRPPQLLATLPPTQGGSSLGF